jgi:prephenate dehydrogenase
MIDSDPKREALAQDLVGSKFSESLESPDLVIFSLPTSYLPMVIEREFRLNAKATFMDIGSIKTKPLQDIRAFEGLAAQFCGTHPMAGREVGGPESARADLFEGRPWIYCPDGESSSTVISTVEELIAMMGASPIRMDAQSHDAAVALISHLPQLSASALASQLVGAPEEWLALAGQGLKDSTRIADSDPTLWSEIITLNREHIRPLLQKLTDDLHSLLEHFDDEYEVKKTIENGRRGRAQIPGKHGGKNRDYFYLPIVIEDKPGQLALLFQECADAGVNVEDLAIEHSPGQFTGLISLALSKADSEKLAEHLSSRGWKVHGL